MSCFTLMIGTRLFLLCCVRQKHLRFKVNLYKLREERTMSPRVVSNLLGGVLYGRRFSPWYVAFHSCRRSKRLTVKA